MTPTLRIRHAVRGEKNPAKQSRAREAERERDEEQQGKTVELLLLLLLPATVALGGELVGWAAWQSQTCCCHRCCLLAVVAASLLLQLFDCLAFCWLFWFSAHRKRSSSLSWRTLEYAWWICRITQRTHMSSSDKREKERHTQADGATDRQTDRRSNRPSRPTTGKRNEPTTTTTTTTLWSAASHTNIDIYVEDSNSVTSFDQFNSFSHTATPTTAGENCIWFARHFVTEQQQ